ncbi:MAG: hypothetical protein GXY36_13170, partial [Chloroflexi bacterium]|nr:hypothetical protein [Chloroflexota bacterium]
MRKDLKTLSVMALLIVMVLSVAVPVLAADEAPAARSDRAQLPAVDLIMWTKESPEFMAAIDMQGAFDTWAAENAPGSTLTIETKDVEQVRTELQTVALAGEGVPHFLWTVADHVGPFTEVG